MNKSLQEISEYYFERFGYASGRLEPALDPSTKMIIVIPVHNEPDLAETLNSLNRCDRADTPVEVIVVVNNSEDAENSVREQNLKSIDEINSWIQDNPDSRISCNVMSAMNLPAKHAGVGLARKIGMDAALRRFATINYNGLIVCLDADCTVHPSYLKELESNFCTENFVAGNIYYEHPLAGDIEATPSGIGKYELGLRYYVNALRFAGYPYSYHTIGSSMAVSAITYAKSGGMNKRKAGEDFYFLHKLIPLGGFRELNSTAVYPSSRISERVPFGTGLAMLRWQKQISSGQSHELESYCFKTFRDLKEFIASIIALRECTGKVTYTNAVKTLPHSIQEFLMSQNFYDVLNSCIAQSTSEAAYLKRIYAWLDGFMVLKFVHFARAHFYPEVPVEQCARELLGSIHVNSDGSDGVLLETYRELDRSR